MFMEKSFKPFPSINELPIPPLTQSFFQYMTKTSNVTTFFPNTNQEYIKPSTPIIKGPWSPIEDQQLRTAIQSMSPIIWEEVAKFVPTRTANQCKERWMYRLNPNVNTSRFEPWEDEIIKSERKKVGNHWTLIAQKLPGRTPCGVKNRWYSVLRKQTNNQ